MDNTLLNQISTDISNPDKAKTTNLSLLLLFVISLIAAAFLLTQNQQPRFKASLPANCSKPTVCNNTPPQKDVPIVKEDTLQSKIILSGSYYLNISNDFSSKQGIYGKNSIWLERTSGSSQDQYPYFNVAFLPHFFGTQTENELSIGGIPFSVSCEEGKPATLCNCDLVPKNEKIPIINISIGCGLKNPGTYEETVKKYLNGITFSPDLKKVLLGESLPKELIANDGSYFFRNKNSLFRITSDYIAELVTEEISDYRVFPEKGIALYETEKNEKNKGTCYYQWVFDLKTGEKILLNNFVNTPALRKKYSAQEVGLYFNYSQEPKAGDSLSYEVDDCWNTYRQDKWVYDLAAKVLLPQKSEADEISTSDPRGKLYYCYQDKPFTLTKESLVGVWQDNESMASGWSDRYEFSPDGKYSYYPSEMNCEKRLIRETGTWQIKGNLLVLEKKEEQVMAGGWYERSGGSCGSLKTLVGATPEINVFNTPISKNYNISVGLQKKESNPVEDNCEPHESILINKTNFWKFQNEPD